MDPIHEYWNLPVPCVAALELPWTPEYLPGIEPEPTDFVVVGGLQAAPPLPFIQIIRNKDGDTEMVGILKPKAGDTSAWTAVEDGLPEPSRIVLVFCPGPMELHEMRATAWHDGQHWFAGTRAMESKVTHWMELPAPPSDREAPSDLP